MQTIQLNHTTRFRFYVEATALGPRGDVSTSPS
jgi:hypothetical protein